MKRDKKLFPAVIMALGAFALMAAVICSMAAQWYDYVIALLGCAGICAAAIWNGVKSRQFHIQHHIIRILLSCALIIGFIFL